MNTRKRRFRRWRWLAAIVVLLAVAGGWLRYSSPVSLAQGIFWQPDSEHLQPHGAWNQIGVHTLIVQYASVDHHAWFPNAYLDAPRKQPDWQRIRQQPWARRIVMGLAGNYSEQASRANVDLLARLSTLLGEKPPLPASAYYFPIEADPSWKDVGQLGTALASMPKPLWVSIYSRPIAPEALATWVQTWLPDDVGVMLQDGVGVGDRSPQQAQALFHALQRKLGKQRVIMVAETFRQDADGSLHQASLTRLAQQLRTYRGDRIYLYDTAHLPDWKVWLLKLWFKTRADARPPHPPHPPPASHV